MHRAQRHHGQQPKRGDRAASQNQHPFERRDVHQCERGALRFFGGDVRQPVDIGDADRRQNENRVNDGLPHHAGFGVAAFAGSQRTGLDEGAQQMDRRDADDRHRELDLEHAGVDMAEPFRLVGMPLQIEARDERLVAADDDHHQQVGDHHHVDQTEHRQHDLLLAEVEGVLEQVPQFLEEQHHIDALRHDQPDIERQLQPARAEDQHRDRTQGAPDRLRGQRCFRRHGHGSGGFLWRDLLGGCGCSSTGYMAHSCTSVAERPFGAGGMHSLHPPAEWNNGPGDLGARHAPKGEKSL